VNVEADNRKGDSSPASIAKKFVAARLRGSSLAEFPGTIPSNLEVAYLCQEAAIPRWPDVIAGWKIGLVSSDVENAPGQMRLAGPIFRRSVIHASSVAPPVIFPVFVGGFAAVEAEFVFEISRDVPAEKLEWTSAEALDFAPNLHIGVELAGSPLASINALGPKAVVSDFGNNTGLIVGPPIIAWRETVSSDLVSEVYIDDLCVGRGNAASMPGGPTEALRWLLEHCARRRRPLKRGQFVSTGAVTGIHTISAGQTAVVGFGIRGSIACVATAAAPT
jgi:2-keto-4-pentenoate hydratase